VTTVSVDGASNSEIETRLLKLDSIKLLLHGSN